MAEGSAEAISAEARQKTAEANRQNSLQREILTYEELIPKLREMIRTIEISQPFSDQKLISGQSPYKNVTKTKSERLITTLVALKKEGNYLIKRASEFTENGDFPIYSGKMYKKKKNQYTKKKTKREINIHDMNNTLLELSKAKLDSHDVDLLVTLGEIHLEKFNAEAKALQKVPSIRRDMSTLRQRLKDRDTKGHVETYKRAKKSSIQAIRSGENFIKLIDSNIRDVEIYLKNLQTIPAHIIMGEIEERIVNQIKEIKTKLSNLFIRETDEGRKILIPKEKAKEDDKKVTYEELDEMEDVPEYFSQLLDRMQEMRETIPKEAKEELNRLSDKIEENAKKIEGMMSDLDSKFMKELKDIMEEFSEVLDETDGIELPSKNLSRDLTKAGRSLNTLVVSIKKLFREIEDMGEEAQKEWKAWMKSGEPKELKRGKSTIGVDMKGLRDLLRILPEEAGQKQLEDLGLEESDIKQVNVLVGEITGLISEVKIEINKLRQSIPSAEDKDETEEEIAEREEKERKEKKKDFEETGEYTTRPEVGRTEYDYREEETSWTEEDYTDEQQLGGKEYQARARAERAKRKED